LSQYPIGPHDTVELFSPSSGGRGALFPDSSIVLVRDVFRDAR
jgi:hypothetical protein